MTIRRYWLEMLLRICGPVLQAASDGELRIRLPVETAAGVPPASRRSSHMEALARSLAGMAPWLALASDGMDADEAASHGKFNTLALTALRNTFCPGSPDSDGAFPPEDPQILVEAAILSLALLRAPPALWAGLDADTQHRLLEWLRDSRGVTILERSSW